MSFPYLQINPKYLYLDFWSGNSLEIESTYTFLLKLNYVANTYKLYLICESCKIILTTKFLYHSFLYVMLPNGL